MTFFLDLNNDNINPHKMIHVTDIINIWEVVLARYYSIHKAEQENDLFQENYKLSEWYK